MIRTISGRPATIAQLRRRAYIKARVAEQWNVEPECDGCGLTTCTGCTPAEPEPVVHRCARGCGALVSSEFAWCLPCARDVA